jgi:hypothetical protein
MNHSADITLRGKVPMLTDAAGPGGCCSLPRHRSLHLFPLPPLALPRLALVAVALA